MPTLICRRDRRNHLDRGRPAERQFYVTTLPTGTVNNFYGGGGSDEYVLRDVFTTGGIRGGVQVFEYSGTNEILVDNYFGATGATFHIENGSVGTAPGDNLFGPGGYLTYYGDFELSFRLSNNGADTVYAVPDPTTTSSSTAATRMAPRRAIR